MSTNEPKYTADPEDVPQPLEAVSEIQDEEAEGVEDNG